MSSLMTTLGIDRLGPEERLQLAEEILDSLREEGVPPALTDAQRQELDRRVAALDTGLSKLSPRDDVEARILARLRP